MLVSISTNILCAKCYFNVVDCNSNKLLSLLSSSPNDIKWYTEENILISDAT